MYQAGLQKPHEEQKGMQLRHRTLQPLADLTLPKKTPAPAPVPAPAPQILPFYKDAPAPAKQTKVPRPKAPRPAKDTPSTRPAVERGPCANPLCGVTTCPQWRIGPNGEDMCNACAMHAKRHPGTMRDPAASPAKQQPSTSTAAAAGKAAKAAAAAGPSKPPTRRATTDNNLDKTHSAEQQHTSSGAAIAGQQVAKAKAELVRVEGGCTATR